jgi:ABC-type branched-subunit amino acid transport system ATPase component
MTGAGDRLAAYVGDATADPGEAAVSPPVLELRGVSRYFGGVRAVDGVDLVVQEGQLYGLIGPNGAGKTTLLDIISGFQPVTSGEILYLAEPATRWPPHRLAASGVARTFQTVRLFRAMTALENVLVGMHSRRRSDTIGQVLVLPALRRAQASRVEEGRWLLDRVGLAGAADRIAGELSFGDQRRLEIARALALKPRLLLLDEPAAGANPKEGGRLQALLVELNAAGLTMVLVEHHLRLVMETCSDIAVLDFGVKIADGKPQAVVKERQVIEAYLGQEAVQSGQVQ